MSREPQPCCGVPKWTGHAACCAIGGEIVGLGSVLPSYQKETGVSADLVKEAREWLASMPAEQRRAGLYDGGEYVAWLEGSASLVARLSSALEEAQRERDEAREDAIRQNEDNGSKVERICMLKEELTHLRAFITKVAPKYPEARKLLGLEGVDDWMEEAQ